MGRSAGDHSGHSGQGLPSGAPPTLSLVLSRRARREAAAAAAAASTTDPRLEIIERMFTGFQLAGNLGALALSAVAWVWLAAHRSDPGSGQAPDTLAGAATDVGGLAGHPLLQPLTSISGATLVLLMLPTCLLMAPSVNPFYAAPSERRLLHAGRAAVFAVLAVSTVAVIAGAAR